MKCATCGNEVSNNEQVCPICGTSKAANVQSQEMYEMQNSASGSYCTMCGRPIPDGYKMCSECIEKKNLSSIVTKKKKSYGWLIALLVVLVLLFGTVAVGFWSGFFDNFITEPVSDNVGDNDDSEASDDSGKDDGDIDDENNSDDDDSDEEDKKSTYSISVPLNTSNASTWTTSSLSAQNAGGKLACINTKEEFESIVSMLDKCSEELKVVWIGARRYSDQSWDDVKWLDGSEMSFAHWYDNEPSYYSDGQEEMYLMLFKVGDEWYFNDAANDVSEFYAAKSVGYITEKVE